MWYFTPVINSIDESELHLRGVIKVMHIQVSHKKTSLHLTDTDENSNVAFRRYFTRDSVNENTMPLTFTFMLLETLTFQTNDKK